jgi:S-adenosylmethionine decarboxylase proenzyme
MNNDSLMNQNVHHTVGTHILLNVYHIPDIDLLRYLERGLPILRNIVNELQLHVMNEAGHQFHPYGYTYAFVLSESHFTIHTYPEYQSCYIDIFCCNDSFNPVHAINYIKNAFQTIHVTETILRR